MNRFPNYIETNLLLSIYLDSTLSFSIISIDDFINNLWRPIISSNIFIRNPYIPKNMLLALSEG